MRGWGKTPILGLGFIALFEGLLIHDDDADAHRWWQWWLRHTFWKDHNITMLWILLQQIQVFGVDAQVVGPSKNRVVFLGNFSPSTHFGKAGQDAARLTHLIYSISANQTSHSVRFQIVNPFQMIRRWNEFKKCCGEFRSFEPHTKFQCGLQHWNLFFPPQGLMTLDMFSNMVDNTREHTALRRNELGT